MGIMETLRAQAEQVAAQQAAAKAEAEDPRTSSEKLAEALASTSDMMATLQAGVVGYRATAEANGFSPACAEMMALQYHQALMGVIF